MNFLFLAVFNNSSLLVLTGDEHHNCIRLQGVTSSEVPMLSEAILRLD